MNQLTDYMQISELCFGRYGIYLAHVTSMVLLFHIIDVQKPCAMLVVFVVCHTDARIPRDHMIVHGQYGWLLEMYPRHLRMEGRKEIIEVFNALYRTYISSMSDVSDVNHRHRMSTSILMPCGTVSYFRWVPDC